MTFWSSGKYQIRSVPRQCIEGVFVLKYLCLIEFPANWFYLGGIIIKEVRLIAHTNFGENPEQNEF
jgi:hypothetical protein